MNTRQVACCILRTYGGVMVGSTRFCGGLSRDTPVHMFELALLCSVDYLAHSYRNKKNTASMFGKRDLFYMWLVSLHIFLGPLIRCRFMILLIIWAVQHTQCHRENILLVGGLGVEGKQHEVALIDHGERHYAY